MCYFLPQRKFRQVAYFFLARVRFLSKNREEKEEKEASKHREKIDILIKRLINRGKRSWDRKDKYENKEKRTKMKMKKKKKTKKKKKRKKKKERKT